MFLDDKKNWQAVINHYNVNKDILVNERTNETDEHICKALDTEIEIIKLAIKQVIKEHEKIKARFLKIFNKLKT